MNYAKFITDICFNLLKVPFHGWIHICVLLPRFLAIRLLLPLSIIIALDVQHLKIVKVKPQCSIEKAGRVLLFG